MSPIGMVCFLRPQQMDAETTIKRVTHMMRLVTELEVSSLENRDMRRLEPKRASIGFLRAKTVGFGRLQK